MTLFQVLLLLLLAWLGLCAGFVLMFVLIHWHEQREHEELWMAVEESERHVG